MSSVTMHVLSPRILWLPTSGHGCLGHVSFSSALPAPGEFLISCLGNGKSVLPCLDQRIMQHNSHAALCRGRAFMESRCALSS